MAIDVEQYQQTSYFGFTCTLQVATEEHGTFLVDACEPGVREALQQDLNGLTSDPSVLKILHGGKDDAVWLQRDFGAHLVNAIDTQIMAKELALPLNLKDLMMSVFEVELDKESQQEDWTQRPLPVQMAYYAAADAHYLLPLTAELWSRVCTASAAARVQRLSTALWQKSLWQPRSITRANPWSKDGNFKNAIREFFPGGTIAEYPVVEAQLKQLYMWRDQEARKRDDGVNNICGKRTLIKRAIEECGLESLPLKQPAPPTKHAGPLKNGSGCGAQQSPLVQTQQKQVRPTQLESCHLVSPELELEPELQPESQPESQLQPELQPKLEPEPELSHLLLADQSPPTAQIPEELRSQDYKGSHVLIVSCDQKKKAVVVVRDEKQDRKVRKAEAASAASGAAIKDIVVKNSWSLVGAKKDNSDGGNPWSTALRAARAKVGLDLTNTEAFRPMAVAYRPDAHSFLFFVVANACVTLHNGLDTCASDWLDITAKTRGAAADYIMRTTLREFQRCVEQVDRSVFAMAAPNVIPQHTPPTRDHASASSDVAQAQQRGLASWQETTGLECSERGFATKAVDVFNPSANKRWAALGDRVIEWAVRWHLCCQAATSGASFVACARCSERMKLLRVGIDITSSTIDASSGCPYCSKAQYTTNRALAGITQRWLKPALGTFQRGRWSPSRDEELSEHRMGTACEAVIGLAAHQFGIREAAKLYGRVADCLPLPITDADNDPSPARQDYSTLLPKQLASRFGTLADVSKSVATAAEWQRCVFLGEATTDLSVMRHHFDSSPHADVGDLHTLTRTNEYRSTKQTALARAAKAAGLGSWASDSVLNQFGSLGNSVAELDVNVTSASECWKAGVGTLVLDSGFELNDADQLIKVYLLESVEPEPEPEPEPGPPEPEPTAASGWGSMATGTAIVPTSGWGAMATPSASGGWGYIATAAAAASGGGWGSAVTDDSDVLDKESTTGDSTAIATASSSGWSGGSVLQHEHDTEEARNRKLHRQVSYYFSNQALMADGDRVMELINEDVAAGGLGFVPLAELMEFGQVKELLDNTLPPHEQTLSAALRDSALLEISPDGLAVRRNEPIPTQADYRAMQDFINDKASQVALSGSAVEMTLSELQLRCEKARLFRMAQKKLEKATVAALHADTIDQFTAARKMFGHSRHHLLGRERDLCLGAAEFLRDGPHSLVFEERHKRRQLLNACRINVAICDLDIIHSLNRLEPEPEPELQPEPQPTVGERLEMARSELQRSRLLEDEPKRSTSRDSTSSEQMYREAPKAVAKFVWALCALESDHLDRYARNDKSKTSLSLLAFFHSSSL
jgi:hypothetical protein